MDGLKRADRLVQGLRKSIAELQIRSNDFGHGNGVIRFEVWLKARQTKVVPRVFSSFTGLRKPFFYGTNKAPKEMSLASKRHFVSDLCSITIYQTRQEEKENEKRLRRITRTRLY